MIELIMTSVVSLVTGAGSMLLFFPQMRKSKILENEAKQSDEWRKLYAEEKKLRQEERTEWEIERNQLNGKIDSLFDQINKHRDEKAEVIKENTRLEVENTRLTMLKCEVINCVKRQPPTGY